MTACSTVETTHGCDILLTDMEPRQTTPENLPPQEVGREQQSSASFEAPIVPEAAAGIGRNEETERRLGQRVEVATQQQAPVQAATLPVPVVGQQSDDSSVVQDDDAPMVAADEDLIEKEWVDRAKKVISDTKDDPYKREQEVKRLQIDYVKKRYGKSIGASTDSDWETQLK